MGPAGPDLSPLLLCSLQPPWPLLCLDTSGTFPPGFLRKPATDFPSCPHEQPPPAGLDPNITFFLGIFPGDLHSFNPPSQKQHFLSLPHRCVLSFLFMTVPLTPYTSAGTQRVLGKSGSDAGVSSCFEKLCFHRTVIGKKCQSHNILCGVNV